MAARWIDWVEIVIHRRRVLKYGLGAAAALWIRGAAGQAAASLEGRVVDADGAPVHGAVITVSSPGLPQGDVSLVSDGAGGFRVESVEPALYDISVDADGFRQARLRDVLLEPGQTASVELVLERRFPGQGSY